MKRGRGVKIAGRSKALPYGNTLTGYARFAEIREDILTMG